MRRARVLAVGATIVATALVVLFVANLTLGDKHIEQRVETLYASADAQLRRNMNVMFGPTCWRRSPTRSAPSPSKATSSGRARSASASRKRSSSARRAA